VIDEQRDQGKTNEVDWTDCLDEGGLKLRIVHEWCTNECWQANIEARLQQLLRALVFLSVICAEKSGNQDNHD